MSTIQPTTDNQDDLKPTKQPCPVCGSEMVPRRSRSGNAFYGCVQYPECRGTRDSKGTARIPKVLSVIDFNQDKQATAGSIMEDAMKLIRRCGSIRKAVKAVNAARLMIEVILDKDES